MTRVTIARRSWVSLAVLLSLAGPVAAEPARPTFHQEAGRIVDQVAEHLRGLAAQLDQHLARGPGRGETGRGGPAPAPAERPLITLMLDHRADLGLTPDQVTRLEAMRTDFTREAIRRDAEIRVAELDLASLLAQEAVELARAEAKIREVAQLRADLRIARLRTIEQAKGLLTAEQRARLWGLLGSGPQHGARRPADSGTRL